MQFLGPNEVHISVQSLVSGTFFSSLKRGSIEEGGLKPHFPAMADQIHTQIRVKLISVYFLRINHSAKIRYVRSNPWLASVDS